MPDTVVRCSETGRLYLVLKDMRRHLIPNIQTFCACKFRDQDIKQLTPAELRELAEGTPLPKDHDCMRCTVFCCLIAIV